MKIAITGARGTVGQKVVQICAKEGHETVQVNRTDQEYDGTPISEMRTADTASHYDATLSQCYRTGIRKPISEVRVLPIDEDCPVNPTDSYALAKQEAETQAKAFVNWYPGTKIAMLHIHEVAPKQEVLKEHEEDWENAAVKQLWSWANPEATARACLLAVTESDEFEGCEIFTFVARTTTQDTPSEQLAKKYYPDVKVKGDMSTNVSFWTYDKIERVLGWKYTERE